MNAMGFIKLESVEDFPGDYAKCGECGEVVLQDLTKDHKCPMTKEEQGVAEAHDRLKQLMAIVGDENVSVADRVKAWEDHEHLEEFMFKSDLAKVEKRFTPEVLYGLVREALQGSLDFLQVYRDREYARNDELRSKGVPYVERIKQLNTARIEWCNQYEAQLRRDMRDFRVRPLQEWLGRFDLEQARERGMRWVIRFNLERTYYVPQKYGKKESSK